MDIRIPLARSETFAVVDAIDGEKIFRHRWAHFLPSRSSTAYAKARGTQNLYMHRLVLDAPRGVQVDHINGNGLDNRRANLRLCSQSLNNANSPSNGASA